MNGPKLVFITDPLHMTKGAVAPAIELAKYLNSSHSLDIILLTLFAKKDILKELRGHGIRVYTLKKNLMSLTRVPTFDSWLRAVLRISLGIKERNLKVDEDTVIINTSSTLAIPSHIYYALGPMTYALRDMVRYTSPPLRVGINLSLPLLERMEKRFFSYMRSNSRLFIAISYFTKSMYMNYGIVVDGVIYAPLDTQKFKPTTKKPSADYILTYIGVGGKEGIPTVIREIADRGIKIKVFGMKAIYVPKYLYNHPNIEFLGYVSDEELVDLYSNALYTLFTFTHEPFGYIPVESMACGTPVLTYNKQGPSETVINGVTGWLADNDKELVKLAVKLWREGYPSWMRSRSRERALEFDVKVVANKWLEVIKQLRY